MNRPVSHPSQHAQHGHQVLGRHDIAGFPASQELGEWPRSLSLLEKMFAAAVQGDVVMFNAVAHVCQKVDAKGMAIILDPSIHRGKNHQHIFSNQFKLR